MKLKLKKWEKKFINDGLISTRRLKRLCDDISVANKMLAERLECKTQNLLDKHLDLSGGRVNLGNVKRSSASDTGQDVSRNTCDGRIKN